MTQADGKLPTPEEIRLQMRILKPLVEALEAALTASARLNDKSSMVQRFKALSDLTKANKALGDANRAMGVALGLPFDEVIENVSYTAIFGPDD